MHDHERERIFHNHHQNACWRTHHTVPEHLLMFNLFYIFYYAPFFVLDVMVLGFRLISRLKTLHQASMIRFTLNVTFDKIVNYYVINKHLNNCPYSSVFLSANSQSSRERKIFFGFCKSTQKWIGIQALSYVLVFCYCCSVNRYHSCHSCTHPNAIILPRVRNFC